MDIYRWAKIQKKPFTDAVINRLKCIRCGAPAVSQCQIRADGNNYRPICRECDIALNRLVLKFMRHPHWGQAADEYAYGSDNNHKGKP